MNAPLRGLWRRIGADENASRRSGAVEDKTMAPITGARTCASNPDRFCLGNHELRLDACAAQEPEAR